MTISEKVRAVHYRNGNMCERCGKRSTEVAHGISKGKYGRKAVKTLWKDMFDEVLSEKDIDDIIHHEFNTHASCRLCNDYFNIHISQLALMQSLLRRIYDDRHSKTNN